MSTLSYNFNDKVICGILYHDDQIVNITISPVQENDSREAKTRKATGACLRLLRISAIQTKDVVFRYPSILKGNKQEKILRTRADEYGLNISSIVRRPFSLNGSICTMYKRDTINKPSFNSDEHPWFLYTDASIVSNRETTVGNCIVDASGHILSINACVIDTEVQNTKVVELYSGLVALRIIKKSKYDSSELKWFCDNERTIDAFRSNDYMNMSKKDVDMLNSVRSCFDNIDYNSISGSDNRVADAVCKDIRHREVEDLISYSSPFFDKYTEYCVGTEMKKLTDEI